MRRIQDLAEFLERRGEAALRTTQLYTDMIQGEPKLKFPL